MINMIQPTEGIITLQINRVVGRFSATWEGRKGFCKTVWENWYNFIIHRRPLKEPLKLSNLE